MPALHRLPVVASHEILEAAHLQLHHGFPQPLDTRQLLHTAHILNLACASWLEGTEPSAVGFHST